MTADPPLSTQELERYARHIVLAEVGGAGQQAFKAARVLVVGRPIAAADAPAKAAEAIIAEIESAL